MVSQRHSDFFDKIERFSAQEGNCLVWTGCIKKNGYGRLTYKRKQYHAHRVSFEIFNGDIPQGLDVCHSCDNRKCISPSHLFVGTRADNMRDAKKKGRIARGEKIGKLTGEQASEIKASKEKTAVLANRFGVTVHSIRNIKRGATWRHLTKEIV